MNLETKEFSLDRKRLFNLNFSMGIKSQIRSFLVLSAVIWVLPYSFGVSYAVPISVISVLLFLHLSSYLRLYFSYNRNENRNLFLPRKFRFLDDGFEMHGVDLFVSMKYSKLVNYKVIKDYIILFESNMLFYYVPMESFENESDRDALIKLLNDIIPVSK